MSLVLMRCIVMLCSIHRGDTHDCQSRKVGLLAFDNGCHVAHKRFRRPRSCHALESLGGSSVCELHAQAKGCRFPVRKWHMPHGLWQLLQRRPDLVLPQWLRFRGRELPLLNTAAMACEI